MIKYYVIKHLTLLKIQNMGDIKVGLLQWVTNFLIKSAITNIGTEVNSENQQLAEELHEPLIRKFKNCKVYSSYRDNKSGGD